MKTTAFVLVAAVLAGCASVSTEKSRTARGAAPTTSSSAGGDALGAPRGWEGLRVAVLGDSITDKHQAHEIYWQYLAAWLKWDVHGYGVSGQRWLHIPEQADAMIKEMGDDVDAILIMMGTNDFAAGDKLGEWYVATPSTVNWWGQDRALEHRAFNFDKNTVKGRINVALDKLKRRYPDSQIVILTPTQRAFFQCSPTNVQPAMDWPNTDGRYLDEYVAAAKEGAAIWGCPVIDLYGEAGLVPLLKDEYAKYYRNKERDLLHPNGLGHRRLADLIYCKLRSLPATFRRD